MTDAVAHALCDRWGVPYGDPCGGAYSADVRLAILGARPPDAVLVRPSWDRLWARLGAHLAGEGYACNGCKVALRSEVALLDHHWGRGHFDFYPPECGGATDWR